MKIEILGPGCARCRATEQNVRKALAELKIDAEVEHITDPAQFVRRGVMLTPGVIVDGKVVTSGRVPSSDEVKTWLAQRASASGLARVQPRRRLYARGWPVEANPRALGHGSGFPGISSNLSMYQDSGYTLAVMSSVDGGSFGIVHAFRTMMRARHAAERKKE